MRRASRIMSKIDAEESLYPRVDEYMNKWSMRYDGTRKYRSFKPGMRWYRWVLMK